MALVTVMYVLLGLPFALGCGAFYYDMLRNCSVPMPVGPAVVLCIIIGACCGTVWPLTAFIFSVLLLLERQTTKGQTT